jgi:hypothetical protein
VVTYTVTVANAGLADAALALNDYMADVLDDADFVAGSLHAEPPLVACVLGNGDISLSGPVAKGATLTLTYQVRVKDEDAGGNGTLVNTVDEPGLSQPGPCDPDDPACTVHEVVWPPKPIPTTSPAPSSSAVVTPGPSSTAGTATPEDAATSEDTPTPPAPALSTWTPTATPKPTPNPTLSTWTPTRIPTPTPTPLPATESTPDAGPTSATDPGPTSATNLSSTAAPMPPHALPAGPDESVDASAPASSTTAETTADAEPTPAGDTASSAATASKAAATASAASESPAPTPPSAIGTGEPILAHLRHFALLGACMLAVAGVLAGYAVNRRGQREE